MIDAVQKMLGFIKERKTAYQLAFRSPAGQAVMQDLAKFCRANATCFHEDPRVHAALEGRREVWLRIQEHLNLTTEELADLYSGRTIRFATTEDEDNA